MENQKRIKVVALYGKAGAGKDTVMQQVIKMAPNLCHEIVSCTTRPPREGEVNGVNYHFLTVEEFTHKVLSGDMLEATEFREWFYGTALDALSAEQVNIGVFNTAGLEALFEDTRLEVLPVSVEASDKTRLMRQLNRETNPDCEEICRRFFADKQDFKRFEAEIELDFEEYIWYIDNDNGHLDGTIIELVNLISDFNEGQVKGIKAKTN